MSLPRRRVRRPVLALAAGLAATAPARAAAPPILAVDDVRPGMTATVKTVLSGTRISEFEVEIVSVVHDVGPDADMILARGMGAPLDSLGVSQGMSGSPAYVDGKLLGAVSSTWSFTREPLFGITPAGQMESEADWSAPAGARAGGGSSSAPRGSAPAPRSSVGFAPIGAPLILSGFDRRLVDLAAERFAPFGFSVSEGGTAGRTQQGGAIEPGATLCVRLAGGDVDVTAIGAVTWVDGDRVYGWGHPFFQMGEVELPLVTGYIHAVVPSQAISFKLGSGAETVGTITSDRRSGIAGRLGVMPHLTRFDLTVTRDGRPEKFRYELVRGAEIGPALVGMVAANSLLARGGNVAEETIRFRQRLVLDDGRDTVVETMFTGDQTVGQIVDLLSQATRVLAANPFEDVAVDRIEAEIDVQPGVKAAFLTEASLDHDTPRPGDALTGTYVLRDWRGAESRHRFRLDLPKDAREGRYLLLLSDAASAEQYEAERDPRSFQPRTLDELLDRIRRLARTDVVHVHLYRQSKGVQLDGRPLADLPPSVLSVMGGASRSGIVQELPAEIVRREEIEVGKFIQGGHSILFEVEKEKP